MITELPSCGPRSAQRPRISVANALIALVLVAVLNGSGARALSPTDPIPDLGAPTGDGFVSKCYWVGTFKSGIRARGQGVTDAFGQLLSPVCFSQATDCNFIATEEVDGSGQMRIVLRSAKWSTSVSNLHYWFKPNRPEKAGGDVKAQGNLPLTGRGAPQLTVTHREGFLDMSFQINPTIDSMKFDVVYRTNVMRPRSEWKNNDIVHAGGPNKTEKWIAPIHGISASDEPVTPLRRTVIRQEWGDPGGSEYYYWVVTRVCEHSEVILKLITPRGDPRTSPSNSGPGQNEFTFNAKSPGQLTINFKASVSPVSAASTVGERVSFSIDPIGNSALIWDHANPNGKAIFKEGFFVATAVFTGLPAKNDDFGLKTVKLLLDGQGYAQTKVEIFFPKHAGKGKLAANHPGGVSGTPNWFHYWKEGGVCGMDADTVYDPDDTSNFGYCDPQNTGRKVYLTSLSGEKNDGPTRYYPSSSGYGSILVVGKGKGIKCVAETIEHERHHIWIYEQFHAGIVAASGSDPDGDGVPTLNEATLDGVRSDPDDPNTYNIPKYPEIGDDEVRCRKKELRLTTVQYYPAKDWANPGCQSKNKWGPD